MVCFWWNQGFSRHCSPMLCNKFEELNDFLRFFSSFITILPESFQFFFFWKNPKPNRKPGFLKNKNRNPTQTGAAKTQTQPKPKIFRKTQPVLGLKILERIKLIGLRILLFLSPFNLVIFAGTQNGQLVLILPSMVWNFWKFYCFRAFGRGIVGMTVNGVILKFDCWCNTYLFAPHLGVQSKIKLFLNWARFLTLLIKP